jgi:hypothetical protein
MEHQKLWIRWRRITGDGRAGARPAMGCWGFDCEARNGIGHMRDDVDWLHRVYTVKQTALTSIHHQAARVHGKKRRWHKTATDYEAIGPHDNDLRLNLMPSKPGSLQLLRDITSIKRDLVFFLSNTYIIGSQ